MYHYKVCILSFNNMHGAPSLDSKKYMDWACSNDLHPYLCLSYEQKCEGEKC